MDLKCNVWKKNSVDDASSFKQKQSPLSIDLVSSLVYWLEEETAHWVVMFVDELSSWLGETNTTKIPTFIYACFAIII